MTNENNTKKFLFLSDSDRESAKSRLAVAGVPYVKKRLESGPANWSKIVAILDAEDFLGVLVKLTDQTMRHMLRPEYEEVARELLARVRSLPHIVFVHSSFFGLTQEAPIPVSEDEDSWFGFGPYGFFDPLDDIERTAISNLFNEFELDIVPYRRNVELSLLAGDFVETHQSNLIFRFYVPSGKIYAEQTVDMLSLFRDYLARSMSLEVRQSTHATARGTVYEFFGDGEMSQEDVTGRFAQFTQVMDMCIIDPTSAERLLVDQGADAQLVGRLVTDYSKKLRRINSDIRQERERKILDIRHRLESDLVELASEAELDAIRQLVDQVIPAVASLNDIVNLGTSRLNQVQGNNLVVNVRPQFINHVQGVVAQEVTGDQNFGPEPMQLLELIRDSNLPNTAELQSAVHELEDSGISPQKRVSSGRKLQSFLGKLGGGAVDVGFGVLQSYIESKLGI